jgi:hypothetical protein
MKRNTPEEEALLISESSETTHFKFINQKIQAYKQFIVGDVVIDTYTKKKYMITYIDPDFGLIYGRFICNSGRLGKNIHHITAMYTTFEHDKEQVDAMLLGDTYDPTAKSRALAKQKREIYAKRVKQRKKVPGDPIAAHDWCENNLSENQTIWITTDPSEDRVANEWQYKVNSIGHHLFLVDWIGNRVECMYSILWKCNLYLEEPIVYKELL